MKRLCASPLIELFCVDAIRTICCIESADAVQLARLLGVETP
jgi:hypothetical protein